MKLSVLSGDYSVSQYAPTTLPPAEAFEGEFTTVSRTADELSVVAETRLSKGATKTEAGFKAIKVEGPLDFGLTGILARLATPLAEAKISIFAISTFDTDYVLVRAGDLARTKDVLEKVGCRF